MSKNTNHKQKSHPEIVCTAPALGAQVPDYIVDRLTDAEAEFVEDHLLQCKGCREMYLTILFTRERGRRRRLAGKSPALPDELDVQSQQG